MATFRAQKVVSALPASLAADTIYAVRVGAGFDLYITDSTGQIAHKVNSSVTSVAGKTGAVTLAKADVGLGNVDNTSDAAKPVSTATQTALNGKVDKVTGKGLSTEDFTTAEQTKLAGIAVGAQVNVPTDLSVTAGTTAGPTINSSTGANATIPAASATLSGVVTTGSQTFAGAKTFSSPVAVGAGTATTHAVRGDRTIATSTGLLGGGNLTGNRTLSIDIATQAEAEAGTDNAHVMTPLRVKQAIDVGLNALPQLTGRNLIINGDFRINQRGYVSGTNMTGANQFTLDRWFVQTSGQNVTFTGNDSGRTITAPAGGAAQGIEGANIKGGSYVANWTGSGTCTIGGVARSKGVPFTLTAGAPVRVVLVGQVSEFQLERGTVPTPFEWRDIGDELRHCQRYYQAFLLRHRFFSSGASHVGGSNILFPVTMRATPAAAFLGNAYTQNVGSVLVAHVTNSGAIFELIASAAGDTFRGDNYAFESEFTA